MADIIISEVGPRDGLQSISTVVPTAEKLRWIAALDAAGVAEIELGSFVHPKKLPQMADAAEVYAGMRDAGYSGRMLALVPNLKGAMRALDAGVPRLSIPVSASETHNMDNVGMSCMESVNAVSEICRYVREKEKETGSRTWVEVGIAAAFGCNHEGEIPESWVLEIAEALVRCGVDSVGLSDSTGMGNPTQVKHLFSALRRNVGTHAGSAHFHNTYGLGLANVVAALDAGVTVIDSANGGLGGCPFLPGASGNIVTEDLVYMLESMGVKTGIDLEKLLEARRILADILPDVHLAGVIGDVGLPKTFTQRFITKQAATQ